MPWTIKDVDGFKDGLSDKEKKKWVYIANGVLKNCLSSGESEKYCAQKAIRIANSKFQERFNPVIEKTLGELLKDFMNKKFTLGDVLTDIPEAQNISIQDASGDDGDGDDDSAMDTDMDCPDCPQMTTRQKQWMRNCVQSGNSREECMKQMMDMMMDTSDEFTDLGSIDEMEIFRPGVHNGDEFTEDDLDEIANNFRKLKDEVRPKLKITHRDNQKELAGLASYGDIVDVYTKKSEDGSRRLYATIRNVPKQVINLIKDRRFPERSIEIYPQFKLGTKKESPEYKNVLKAIALLGHEMPAVAGMAPIKLSEIENSHKSICFGEICFPCEEQAENYKASLLGLEVRFKELNDRFK